MPVRPVTDQQLSAVGVLGQSWPPVAVQARIEWLCALRAAYDGAAPKPGEPPTRWCYQMAVGTGQFLTSSPPMLDGLDVTVPMMGAVVDMCRYGGALLWPDDEMGFQTLDPRWWVETPDGWFYLNPMVGDTGYIDTAELWYWSDGAVEISTHSFSSTHLDLEPLAETVVVEAGELVVVPALPLRGHWGTALIEAGVPWQEAAAGRWAGVNKALDIAEHPMVSYRVADADVNEITEEDYDPEASGFDFIDEAKKASEVLDQFAELERVRLPDAVQDVSFESFDYDTGPAMDATEAMRQEFESATSSAGLRDVQHGQQSGIAMKWTYAAYYQLTLSVQNQLIAGVQQSTGGVLSWEHPWHQMDTPEVTDGADTPPPDAATNVDGSA